MNTQVAKFEPPRLPYHPAIQERFVVRASEWKALVGAEVIWWVTPVSTAEAKRQSP